MTPERTETRVLFDTENLFRPYGLRAEIDEKERKRLRQQFPTVPREAALALGAVMARELVDWLEEEGYVRLESRSFGKPHDKGVEASRAALVAKGFTHTNVPEGRDKAEIAANNAATAITEAGESGHIVMGGADGRMLEHAAGLSKTTSGRWRFFIILPQHGTTQTKNFRKGNYRSLGRITLAHIRTKRCSKRKHDPEARAQFRTLVRESLRIHAQQATQLPVLTTLDAIAASMRLDPATDSSSSALQSWLDSAVADLTGKGLSKHVARSLVAWAALNRDVVKHSPSNHEYELLFRAAVELYLRVAPTSDAFAKIRELITESVRSARPLLAVSLERALDGVLLEHP